MILPAQSIRRLALQAHLIIPFHERTVINGKTFGLSSAGYDVRVDMFKDYARMVNLTSGGFILASTIERFSMPHNVLGIVHDKSSWARKGLTVQNTVIEPGWCGYLTLELANHGRDALHIEQGDPIAQIVFHFLDTPTHQPYSGKYQNQEKGPQEAREETS